MSPVVDVLRLFATALTFLTRLPLVARYSYPDPAALGRSIVLFPLVGALIGALLAGVYFLCLSLFGAPSVAAWLTVAAGVLLTGAFHEDGLADSCDGLFGAFSRERQLEIMKDSRIGTYGGAALVLALGSKAAVLSALPTAAIWSALLSAHILSRFSSLPLAYALPYLRDGSNKPVAAGLTGQRLAAGAGLAAILLLLCAPTVFFSGFVLCALIVLGAGWWLQRRLGGITGDLLGAVNQLVEIAVLLVALAMVR